MTADELRKWFDSTELGAQIAGFDGPVPPGLVQRIAYGACMLAYEQGAADTARALTERAKFIIGATR